MRIFRLKKNFFKQGLTLIELLIIITMISLLSTVIIKSLTQARNKGKLASIQSNLNTVRSETELYYLGNGARYGDPIANSSDCNADAFSYPVIQDALVEATKNGDQTDGVERRCVIGVNGQSWAVSIPLVGGGAWCVGSIGMGGLGTATGGGQNDPASCQ